MLIGEYTHAIDDKNRVSLPSKFRKSIGKTMILTRGLDNCLSIYSLADWKNISEKLGGLNFGDANSRKFNRYMLASAVEITPDGAGRILIPQHLKDEVKIEGKVVFAGVYNRIELWNDSVWEAYKKDTLGDANEIAQKLGDVGAI
jgi:MraZ protein